MNLKHILVSSLLLDHSMAYLLGHWKINEPAIMTNVPIPTFEVRNDCVISSSDSAVVSMEIKEYHTLENAVMITLVNPKVCKKPNDWYNLHKYSFFIRYIGRIVRHGIQLRLDFSEDSNNKAHVSGNIGSECIPSLEIIKIVK